MSIWSRLGEMLHALGGSLAGLFQTACREPDAGEPAPHGVAFTIGIIALGAKMAKADGVVTDAEIAAFRQIVQVPDGELRNVARVFDLAKRDVAGFDAYARQLAALFKDERRTLEDVLESLFHIAKADGVIHESELDYLGEVAAIFGFSERQFEAIKARHVAPRQGDPYTVLGIDRSYSDTEIKQAYRRLVRENHPDALVARGVPEEFLALATRKLARINEAYGLIARERGL